MRALDEPGTGYPPVVVPSPAGSAGGPVTAALRTSLDTVPFGLVACDGNARLLYANRLVETMLGGFVVGMPAELWPQAYDLRGPEGDLIRDIDDIPLIAALRVGQSRGRMHQRCCDGLVGLVADVVAVVDEDGVRRGAVGVFEPVPAHAGARASRGRAFAHSGRPADPVEQLRVMLAVSDLLDRRRRRVQHDPLLVRLDAYVAGRLHEPVNLGSIAAAMALSPAYLTHRVAVLTGRPVIRLVRERRMAAARGLLADTDLPVTAVAGRVTPWDPAYFARVFRHFHGCSPAEWRRRCRATDRDDPTTGRRTERAS